MGLTVAQVYEGATAWPQRRPFLEGAPMSKPNQIAGANRLPL